MYEYLLNLIELFGRWSERCLGRIARKVGFPCLLQVKMRLQAFRMFWCILVVRYEQPSHLIVEVEIPSSETVQDQVNVQPYTLYLIEVCLLQPHCYFRLMFLFFCEMLKRCVMLVSCLAQNTCQHLGGEEFASETSLSRICVASRENGGQSSPENSTESYKRFHYRYDLIFILVNRF